MNLIRNAWTLLAREFEFKIRMATERISIDLNVSQDFNLNVSLNIFKPVTEIMVRV